MDSVYLYWLCAVEGIGTSRLRQIINYFGCIENAWHSSAREFKNIKGISDTLIDKIIKRRDYDKLLKEIECFMSKGIRMISIDDNEYPDMLRTIYDPPYVLFMKGTYKKCIKYLAVVGSRKCTPYGKIAARDISKMLSRYGIGIVSGMARGIDTEAHRGALDGNGFTCAVLGCGCDIVYPPENKKLMAEIEEKGAVISEYIPGTIPNSFNFPARNRIISGLADGVLIVEANEKSGALITANFALEQGRDVFAVPGSIFSDLSKGTNSLIKEGAKPVTSIEDILREFNLEYRDEKGEKLTEDQFSQREKVILNIVDSSPIFIDDLIIKVPLKISEVNSLLTSLELKGALKVLPGKFIVKIS